MFGYVDQATIFNYKSQIPAYLSLSINRINDLQNWATSDDISQGRGRYCLLHYKYKFVQKKLITC